MNTDDKKRLLEHGAANGPTMTVEEFAEATPEVETAHVECEGCGTDYLAHPDMVLCHLCRGDDE